METSSHAAPVHAGPESPSGRPAAAEKSTVYRSLWRKLDGALSAFDAAPQLTATLDAIVETLLRDFGQELQLVAGRIYERVDDNTYVLRRWHGDHPPDKIGYTVPITYAAVQLLFERGVLIMRESDPEFDRGIEDPLGVSMFAAMMLGEDNRWILSFSLQGEFDRERTLYMLAAIQHVIGQRLRHQRFRDILEEARLIQLSMLPRGAPSFFDYDVHGRSTPADSVSGDLFDYIPVSSRVLGISVADASGHGLPAALQARDAITGLRMGIEENLKIVSTVQKLNRVINRSSLAARFVSLFYGELEANGNFVYCSAGHPPGLLYSRGRFEELAEGGLVLGPDPDARYDRGYAKVEPGTTIVIYTDGITEATGPGGESFGVDRLKEEIAAAHPLPARALADRIVQAVERFSGRSRPTDDQTVVVIHRPEPQETP